MPDTTRGPKRSIRISLAVVLVAVCLLLGYFWWRFAHLGTTLRPELERTLTQMLGRSVQVGAVRTAGFNQLIIDGLNINAGNTAESASSVTIPHTTVSLNTLGLLMSKKQDPLAEVNAIGVENANLSIQRAADGSWGMEDVLAKLRAISSTARPKVQIITGQITCQDAEQRQITVSLHGSLVPQADRRYQINLTAAENANISGTLLLTGTFSPDTSAAEVKLTGEQIAIKTLAAFLPVKLPLAAEQGTASVQLGAKFADIFHPQFANITGDGEITLSKVVLAPLVTHDLRVQLLKTATKMDAKLHCADATWNDIAVRDINLALANTGVGEPIIVSSFSAVTDYGEINGTDGKLQQDGTIYLPFTAQGVALHNFSEVITGAATLMGEITGSVAAPQVNAKIKAKDGELHGRHFATGDGEMNYAAGKLRLHNVSLQRPGLQFQLVDDGAGYDPFATAVTTDTILKADGASFTEILGLFGVETAGFPDAQAFGTAQIRFAPEGMSLTGKARLTALQKDDYDLSTIDEVNGEFTYAGSKLGFTSLAVVTGETTTQVTGDINFLSGAPVSGDLQLKLEHGRAQDIAPLLASLAQVKIAPEDITGDIGMALHLQGDMDAPVLTGKISYVGDVAVSAINAPFPNILRNFVIEADISGKENELEISLNQCHTALERTDDSYQPGAVIALGKVFIPRAALNNPNNWRWDLAARIANCQLDKSVALVDKTSGYLRLTTVAERPLLSGVLYLENAQLVMSKMNAGAGVAVASPFTSFDPALSVMLQVGENVTALQLGMSIPLRSTPLILPRVVTTNTFSMGNSFLRRNATMLDANKTKGSWGTATGTLNYPRISGCYEVDADQLSLFMSMIPMVANGRGTFEFYPRGVEPMAKK
ncbi:MAG: DUF748 domain-containing protein [bacterium]